MSYYMICSSDKNLQFFTDNKPFAFKTKLYQTLHLSGEWCLAITELQMNEVSNKGQETLYINCNICGESFIDGVKSQLLRRVVINNFENTTFSPCYYVPIIKSEINEIQFQILDQNLQIASNILKPIVLVLHLLKVSDEQLL